jgi:hypothetical protein
MDMVPAGVPFKALRGTKLSDGLKITNCVVAAWARLTRRLVIGSDMMLEYGYHGLHEA